MTDSNEELLKYKFNRVDTIILVTICAVVEDKEKLANIFYQVVKAVNEDKDLKQKLVAGLSKPRIDKLISLIERE